MRKIGIVNYGSGNFASVFNAFERFGEKGIEVLRLNQLNEVSHIVLLGVGSFKKTLTKLNNLGLIDELKEHLLVKKNLFRYLYRYANISGERYRV